MIPETVLNQIQDRLDIVEIISSYVPLKNAGRNFKANCPFHHEKTPSFMVNPDKQIFHCFGCGVGGNIFSFVMKQERKDFREAVEMLAERAGVEIPKDRMVDPKTAERQSQYAKANELAAEFYHNVLLKNKESQKAREYLTRRGLSPETIAEFRLGFAPESWDALGEAMKGRIADAVLEKLGLAIAKKEGGQYDRFRNRVMFPILDQKGAVVAFGGRVMDDSVPKYLNSPESEIYVKGRHLYGLFQARKAVRDLDSVIVVEGYMDLIACHQAGVRNVVASLGTALTSEQVRLIRRHTKNVIMLYDADKAGEAATLRGLELFLEEGLEVKIVRLAAGHDPDSFIKEFGAARFREALANAQTLFEYKTALLKGRYDAKTLEGKVKIANEMVTLFTKVRNEILRAEWVKQLAKELSLSEDALLTEIQRGSSRSRSAAPAESAAKDAAPKTESQAEKLVIGLLLDDPARIAEAKEQVRRSDFSSPAAWDILTALFSENAAELSASHFMNRTAADPEASRILSAACAEVDRLDDKQRAFQDCLSWFKRSRITHEREALKERLVQAEGAGDKERARQVLVEMNELNKGMKQIHEKK